MRHYSIQLADHRGRIIQSSGGVVYVTTGGGTAKLALKDSAGASLSNPLALNRGKIDFYVADTVSSVDLYGQAPGGQAFQEFGVKPSGDNEIVVDTQRTHQNLIIPFNQADFSANTETDTGFDEPASGKALMLPNPSVRVTAIDATETIDVGTLSSDSGDADGFLAAASIATLGLVKGTLTNGSNTMGALFEVQDSANSGDLAPEARVSGGKSITITTSAGSDTGAGFISLPYELLPVGA